MSKKTKGFTVCAEMCLTVSVDIVAESLEDALSQARQMNADEFVEFQGDWVDGDVTKICCVMGG